MLRENPYPGINPHLNSLLQTPGTASQPALWPSFHAAHINHLGDWLNETLPDAYIAQTEQSLQVRDLSWETGAQTRRPDVTVFAQDSPVKARPASAGTLQPTWEATLMDVGVMKRPSALVVREANDQQQLGRVVAWIELLSPANKTGIIYRANRLQTIQSNIPLIEIDYLHESPPVQDELPRYPDDAAAYPYMVVVSDPRPDWREGWVRVYGFDLEANLTRFPLPLLDDQNLIVDLHPVYQRTFISRRYATLLDYTYPPARLMTYTQQHQTWIQEQMARFTAS